LTQNTFERREKRELEVLRLLSGSSMRYIALQKAFVKRTNASPNIFNEIFHSLVLSGRIVKCEDSKFAPYRLTEKGKLLLEALS
jgi:predicted transcriptional regulator